MAPASLLLLSYVDGSILRISSLDSPFGAHFPSLYQRFGSSPPPPPSSSLRYEYNEHRPVAEASGRAVTRRLKVACSSLAFSLQT
ncbi:hypothetical protein PIB30_043445 [Stylosanthes scabra]|uniref:Uncharacterized protein n=1 Tax=Stylosanthes scabra TaxID=79078 RepID=A0ABU6WGL8_9FABA|nr:hypothetical protein [Stylosanthes scabra]